MKKTLLLLCILSSCFWQPAFSQTEWVGSEDYGRIFNITYHPEVENTLYATTLHNHILVSEDNGENWELFFSLPIHEVTEFQQLRMTNNNTAISVIKYNLDSPNNTLLMIDLDTQEIIREMEIPHPSASKYIDAYSIYPGDSDVVLMNTVIDFGNEGITYYTTDGGSNWEEVYTKSAGDGVAISSVAISPDDPQKLVITRGFGAGSVNGGLLVSWDAGTTWEEKLEETILMPVAFNPYNTQEIYTGTGISFGQTPQNLYRSTDGGETWNAVPLMWTEGFLDCINLIAFNPNAMGEIILLEENEIVVSTDNGASWTHYSYTDPEDVHSYYSGWNLSFNPFQQGEVFINSDYHPLFSEDGGATTTWAKNPFFKSTGTVALFQDNEEHLYYGVQYGYVHKNLTTDEETPVDILPLNFYSQGDAPALFVDNITEGRVYTFSSGWFGADFFVSNDHGVTKHQAFNTYMNFVDAVVTNPLNTNEVWVSLSNTMGENELLKLDVTDLQMITSQNLTPPGEGPINGMHFDTNQVGEVLLSAGARVYKSVDGGTNWTLSSNGLDVLDPEYDRILGFSRNPLNEYQFTLATNLGIFTSLDGGENWEQIYEGLVYEVQHSDVTDNHLVGIIYTSAVSDFALVTSSDGGENWELIDNEVFYQTAASSAVVRFMEDTAEVFIGSIDLGLLKHPVQFNTLSTERPEVLGSNLIMYPNPATDHINLHLKSGSISEITVIDAQGVTLSIQKNVNRINLQGLASGVYFLQMTTTTGQQYTRRFIKR